MLNGAHPFADGKLHHLVADALGGQGFHNLPLRHEGDGIGNRQHRLHPLLHQNDGNAFGLQRQDRLLDQGDSMADAMNRSQDVTAPSGMGSWSPDMIWLRFRLLRNKAHVFTSGAQTVPFFEYHGLPAMLVKQTQNTGQRGAGNNAAPAGGYSGMPGTGQWQDQPGGTGDALPLEPQIAGQCGGPAPCPE